MDLCAVAGNGSRCREGLLDGWHNCVSSLLITTAPLQLEHTYQFQWKSLYDLPQLPSTATLILYAVMCTNMLDDDESVNSLIVHKKYVIISDFTLIIQGFVVDDLIYHSHLTEIDQFDWLITLMCLSIKIRFSLPLNVMKEGSGCQLLILCKKSFVKVFTNLYWSVLSWWVYMYNIWCGLSQIRWGHLKQL